MFQFQLKLVTMILLPFFVRYSHFKFRFFSKMTIFLKVSNCLIIIAQTTCFENIKYCKIYFHYGLVLTKTNYNYSASFLWKIFHFQFRFFQKMSIFLIFSNCRIIIAQTTYFENIKYCKINFHYGLVLNKTNYNDFSSFLWKIFHI